MTLLLLLLACGGPADDTGPRRPAPAPEPTAPPSTGSTVVLPDLTLPEPPTPEAYDLGAMDAPTLVATPPGGAFAGTVEVTLEVSDPSATIWYTLDGSLPEAGVSAAYSGPLTLTASTQVRAVAEAFGQPLALAPTYLALQPDLEGFSSDLPLVVLWSEGAEPTFKTEDYDRFTLSSFEPPKGGRVELPGDATHSVSAGLRIRGSSSSGFEKRPYRIETWDPHSRGGVDLDVPLLGMPADGDWVFLSPLVFDRALMRNALMYALSNAIGRYAPRTRFAEVFVADRGEPVGLDDYRGVYVVVERIERGSDRVAITPLQPTDTMLPELSGGYVFKEDRLGPDEQGFWAGDAGGRFDFQQPFVASDPSEADLAPEQRAYLVDTLDELGEALASPGFVHPVTGRHYDAIIDVDSWIDHHILNVFAKNPDAFRLSGYFHKDRDGLVMAGPVWDFDRTMGCSDDSRAEDPTWWDASNETEDCTFVFDHGFWRGLFADPVFAERYWARWQELLEGELTLDAVEGTIDAMEAELAEAAVRNVAAWPGYPPRGGSFEAEVERLRDWIRTRHAWAGQCLALPDPGRCPGM